MSVQEQQQSDVDASPSMPLLHPSIPAGTFDLGKLLEYEPPARWRPEPGDRVRGPLVKREPRIAFNIVAEHLWLLVPPRAFDEHDHFYVVVRCSGVVLSGAVDELRPQVGEEIAIKYMGLRTSLSSGREYGLYRFAVLRDGRWLATR